MQLDIHAGKWLNRPQNCLISDNQIVIVTEPETDFWQRTFYGFQNDNAPAYLFETDRNVSFTCKCQFQYKQLFDQCGVIIYLDAKNWFKASIEYENPYFARLGSVVTNSGYSDWATTDIPHCEQIWYRLSRRNADFLIEFSNDGEHFQQMRIFHLHSLGDTGDALHVKQLTERATKTIPFGVYACSPSQSSFTAKFSDLQLQPCLWKAHEAAPE